MDEQITTTKIYKCVCGKQYNHQSSLSYHKSRCLMVNNDLKDTKKTSEVNIVNPMDLIKQLTEINKKQAELIDAHHKQSITHHEQSITQANMINTQAKALINQITEIERLTQLTKIHDVVVVGNKI